MILPSRTSSIKSWLILNAEPITVALILTAFLALATHCLRYPGFVHDGGLVEQESLRIATAMRERPLWEMLCRGDLAVGLYHGSITSHFLAPFVYFWGPNWTLARLFPVFFGLLTLLLTYWFAREYFGRTVAMVTVFLLAIHPAWIMGIKIGHRFESESVAYGVGALYFLGRWWRTRRGVFLGLGTFWLGWGLGTRLWFVWFFNAMVLLGAVMGMDIIRQWRGRDLLKMGAWGLGGFLAGSFFLVQGLLKKRPMYLIWELMDPKNPNGLWHYFANVSATIEKLHAMLSGSYFMRVQFMEQHGNLLYPWFFWLSVAVCLLARPKGTRGIFVLFFGMLLQMPVYHRYYGTEWDTFFTLYPFPQLMIGIALAELQRRVNRRLVAHVLACLLMGSLAAADLGLLDRYFALLKSTGGRRQFSGAIYGLAEWLEKKNPKAVYCFDQETVTYLKFIAPRLRYRIYRLGPMPNINNFLMRGNERFEGNLPKSVRLMMARGPAGSYYIDHMYTILRDFPFFLEEICKKAGKELRPEKEFSDTSGVPSFRVYSIGMRAQGGAQTAGGSGFTGGLSVFQVVPDGVQAGGAAGGR